MKLSTNIKIKPFPLNILPITNKYAGQAIYPNIYLEKKIFENLSSKHPEPKNIALLIHEQTHIQRQSNSGWFLWGLKYCLIPSFRFNEELEAIKASMKYMKVNNQVWDTDRTAKFLSSYQYLWCTSYENAKQKLDKTWRNL